MKTLLSAIALLITLGSNVGIAQELTPNGKSDSPTSINQQNKNQQSKQDRANQELYKQRKFFNDCSKITRADYKLPESYMSNFVQTTEWQSYRGTKTGIIMTDSNTPIRITTENSNIPEDNITALALDQDGQLWIGTFSSGIVIGTGKDVKPFKTQSIQTRDQHIKSISVNEEGLVWVVYKNGGIECFLNGISCNYFPYQHSEEIQQGENDQLLLLFMKDH